MDNAPRLDRTRFNATTLQTRDLERRRFWRSKTPKERLNALEELRQQTYPDGKAPPIFQRVFRFIKRGEG